MMVNVDDVKTWPPIGEGLPDPGPIRKWTVDLTLDPLTIPKKMRFKPEHDLRIRVGREVFEGRAKTESVFGVFGDGEMIGANFRGQGPLERWPWWRAWPATLWQDLKVRVRNMVRAGRSAKAPWQDAALDVWWYEHDIPTAEDG